MARRVGGWASASESTTVCSSADLPAPVVPATSACGPSRTRSMATAPCWSAPSIARSPPGGVADHRERTSASSGGPMPGRSPSATRSGRVPGPGAPEWSRVRAAAARRLCRPAQSELTARSGSGRDRPPRRSVAPAGPTSTTVSHHAGTAPVLRATRTRWCADRVACHHRAISPWEPSPSATTTVRAAVGGGSCAERLASQRAQRHVSLSVSPHLTTSAVSPSGPTSPSVIARAIPRDSSRGPTTATARPAALAPGSGSSAR